GPKVIGNLPYVRNTKLRGEKGEKMWTASSALFFAATTMATIGYGNIVPATSSGRIACVVFALFGAPLAIITIGGIFRLNIPLFQSFLFWWGHVAQR
ncbi:Ion channel, partial [Ancylostoma duodenale]